MQSYLSQLANNTELKAQARPPGINRLENFIVIFHASVLNINNFSMYGKLAVY